MSRGRLAVAGLAAALLLTGCDDAEAPKAEPGHTAALETNPPTTVRVSSGARAVRLREAIGIGTRKDFSTATKVPPGFERCFVRGFQRDLSVDVLQHLVTIDAGGGDPSTPYALNRVGVSAGDRCRGREHVPELVSAAEHFRAAISGLSPEAVPEPTRFIAPEVPLTKCTGSDRVVGGHDVRVAAMSCADADEILSSFTTAFSDRNLAKELVERGDGWRCYQRIFGGGYSVEETCWRDEGQVVIFKK